MTSFLLYSTSLAANFGGLTGVYSKIMRALGASERVMAIINSAEAPSAIASSDDKRQDSATRDSPANLE
ncbi:unnamed protein product, partial [Ectocarpus sp. 12 AP-2014]